MNRATTTSSAERIVWRISELRELARRLAQAGYQAGLHTNDPNRLVSAKDVAERSGTYAKRAQN